MKPYEECVVGIVGLGLMGGALAMALKHGQDAERHRFALKPARLLGYDIRADLAVKAAEQGIIDESCNESAAMLAECDFVYLCLNPSTLLRFMDANMGHFKSGALITDIAGVKGSIVAAMETTLRCDLDFIPGHPMAGAEIRKQSGAGSSGYRLDAFANSRRVDFVGKNYIFTPLKRNKSENLSWLAALIHRMGFANLTETTAAEHDSCIAFTSQLCHVIAAALIDCESDTGITRFGGGSFEDLTRIAMLNAPMWTELFLENREALLERIGQFEQSLDALKGLIGATDDSCNTSDSSRAAVAAELETRLQAVRERRSAMIG
ncbi:prephenate dehydrogenase [Spirochaetia bacterium]|nr:prephenate dehydrogenase [Spirochaetia bacterium]